MESALFAAGEQFAQEARERALRRDEFGYAWDVRDICADGERGEREWAERRRHWVVCLARRGKTTGVVVDEQDRQTSTRNVQSRPGSGCFGDSRGRR